MENDLNPTAHQQSVNLTLASYNPHPVRRISQETCETIQRLIRTRQEEFELIDSLEKVARVRFDNDALLLDALDADYSYWPADRPVSPDDAREFLQKAFGETMLDADRWPDIPDNPGNVISIFDHWK